jgi:hypothetical protein
MEARKNETGSTFNGEYNNMSSKPTKFTQAVVLLTCIWERLVSNLGQDISCTD